LEHGLGVSAFGEFGGAGEPDQGHDVRGRPDEFSNESQNKLPLTTSEIKTPRNQQNAVIS